MAQHQTPLVLSYIFPKVTSLPFLKLECFLWNIWLLLKKKSKNLATLDSHPCMTTYVTHRTHTCTILTNKQTKASLWSHWPILVYLGCLHGFWDVHMLCPTNVTHDCGPAGARPCLDASNDLVPRHTSEQRWREKWAKKKKITKGSPVKNWEASEDFCWSKVAGSRSHGCKTSAEKSKLPEYYGLLFTLMLWAAF